MSMFLVLKINLKPNIFMDTNTIVKYLHNVDFKWFFLQIVAIMVFNLKFNISKTDIYLISSCNGGKMLK